MSEIQNNSAQTAEKKEKVVLTTSGVLADLHERGLTREEIQKKYGLTKKELVALFKHPKLANRKTIKAPEFGFILEDDLPEMPKKEKQEEKEPSNVTNSAWGAETTEEVSAEMQEESVL